MKFCMPHWKELREGIKARGLWHLVSGSGEELVARMKAAGELDVDPLMVAHNLIMQNALNTAGFEVMRPNDDGTERCPVCFLDAPTWIDKAADGAKEHVEAAILRMKAH